MQQSKRALVAAVSATIAFGFAAPQVAAAPHTGHGHATHATTHGKGGHGAKAKVADHRLANAQRKVAREAARKDKALARSVTDRRVSHLSADTADAVRANVAEDRTSLAALAAEAAATSTPGDLAAVAAEVRAVRPQGYRRVVNMLAHAARIQAGIDAGRAADAAAAQALVDSAIEKALAYRAGDERSALRAIQRDVAGAQTALEGGDDTADAPTGDDTADAPADDTDQTPTDPAPEQPAA